jgi:uncharacterized protein
MKLCGLFLLTVASVFAADLNPAGEWNGMLKPAPSVELRLKPDVETSAAGELKATLFSIDQGSGAIAASTTKLAGDKITLTFPSIDGSYEGQLSADSKTITGTWSQGGGSLPLTMNRGPVPMDTASPSAAPLAGVWEGTLDTGTMQLRLRLNINKDEKGNVTGNVDSIDQNAMGIPASGFVLKGSDFHFDLKAVGGSYDGTVDEKRTAMKGTWRQGGGQLPLEFKKVK